MSRASAGGGLAGKRVVLVVDDHQDTRDLLAEVLEWSGVHAICAGSVPQALEILGGVRVDVIVTDYAMPGIDGLEFLRTIRAGARQPGVPVVMLSGQAGAEVRREVEELGASYLGKPAGIEELLATVRSLLDRTREVGEVG